MTFARTKIQPPRPRASYVERRGVQTRLAEALTARRIALLVAPAGYGKTTLLAHQIAELPAGTAVAWISADAGDDLARLLECMLAALEPFDPPWRTAPESLVARVGSSDDEKRAVAAEIINALDASDVAHGVIVFDDIHRVDDAEFFRFVDLLVERLSTRWCVALTSRTEPPLALARLRGRDEIAEFRQLQLQFAREEARQLAYDAGLGDAQADRIFDRTQGWPAGLRIAIGAVQGAASVADADRALRAGERPLFEFLVTEVLQQLPPTLADFLLAASVLPELEPERCATVTGDRNAAARLADIERLGLFVEVLDAPVRTLRLHDLFREALQQRLSQIDPSRLAALRRRVIDSEPDPVRRIGLLLAAGEGDAAARLAFEHLPSTIVAAGPASAQYWVAQFASPMRDTVPELAYVRGLVHWAQWDFQTMHLEFERAARGFAARGNSSQVALARAQGVMALLALGRLEDAVARVAQLRAGPLDDPTRIVVLNAELWLAIDRCRYELAAPLASEMLDLLQQTDRLDLWYQTTPPLRLPGLPGILPVLARHAELLLQVAGDAPTALRALGLLSQAWCALWRGRLDEARTLAESARNDAQWTGQAGAARAHLLALGAVLCAISGDTEAALDYANARLHTFSSSASAWHQYLLALFVARIAAICEDPGELRSAWLRVEAARIGLGSAATADVTQPRELPLAAQLAWLEGRTDEAIAGWRQALDDEARIDLLGQAAEARIRLARALLRQGDLVAAAQAVAPVFERARVDGPGGVLLAADALRELAGVRWAGALPSASAAQLHAWWKLLAVQRAGRAAASGTPLAAVIPGSAREALSARELEVLQHLAAGDSNKLIARALDLSLHTIKRHVANILGKLDVATRGQAAAWYRSQPDR